MAKVIGSVPMPQFEVGGDFDRVVNEQDRILNELQERSKQVYLSDPALKGLVISFSAADGYAYYVVQDASVRPVQLKHVPYLDGYRAHPVLIKGLDRGDIVEMVRFSRDMDSLLFGSK